MGKEHVVFPENVFSEDHVSAAILEDFECDRYFQAGGEGLGRVHLANGFLESAICKLQRATSPRLLLDAEAECLRIAVWRALVGSNRGSEKVAPPGRNENVEEGHQSRTSRTYCRFMTFRSAPVSASAHVG